jgi:hypothetical protein
MVQAKSAKKVWSFGAVGSRIRRKAEAFVDSRAEDKHVNPRLNGLSELLKMTKDRIKKWSSRDLEVLPNSFSDDSIR